MERMEAATGDKELKITHLSVKPPPDVHSCQTGECGREILNFSTLTPTWYLRERKSNLVTLCPGIFLEFNFGCG